MLRLSFCVAMGSFAIKWLYRRLTTSRIAPIKDAPATSKTPAIATDISADPGAEDMVWVYFGTQTGTAEGFSNELEQESQSKGLRMTVVDMQEFDADEFVQHKTVILVVATYGEGDRTDNSIDFFKWLEDDNLAEDTLAGMKFTVMGLGNRQYVHFNLAATVADEKMARLGATRIYDLGLGDDDQNIEEDFEQWKENGLWPAIMEAVGKKSEDADAVCDRSKSQISGLGEADDVKAKLPLRAVIGDDRAASSDPLVQVGGTEVLGKWYFSASIAPIVVCDELRQLRDEACGKTTKHIEFNTKHLPSLQWKTADNVEILPSNPEDVVDWFAERLGVLDSLESSLNFVRAPGVDKPVRKPFPAPCLVRHALSFYCDLCQAPAKAAARRIAALCTDVNDKDLLESLLNDREAYQWLTGDEVHLSLREFFELFLPSADIDFGTFLQLCPRQKSRPYTISSSSLEDPHRIGVCVSMVLQDTLPSISDILDGLTKRGFRLPANAAERAVRASTSENAKESRRFSGVCSSMLCTRSGKGDKLMITTRPSSFRLPRKLTTPIIMLGAGTGIAPFRAFLREFRAERGSRTKTILFFGCTKQDEDYIYRSEIQEALEVQPVALQELVTAFSREQEHKVYVQHRLKERANQITELIKEGGYVYICGAVSMGKSVRDELTNMLGSSAMVDRLKTDGRLVEELW